MARKARRSQRQRGRQNCTTAAKEGETRTEESRDSTAMEEDVEQDDEKMEEELCGESPSHQQ